MKVIYAVGDKTFTLERIHRGMDNKDAQRAYMELLAAGREIEKIYPAEHIRTLHWWIIYAALDGESINLQQAAVRYADAVAMDEPPPPRHPAFYPYSNVLLYDPLESRYGYKSGASARKRGIARYKSKKNRSEDEE